jgi:hypothetical protein
VGGMARVWYRAVTESLLLIRRRRPLGEPASLRPLDVDAVRADADSESRAATMEGIAGAGRVVLALAEAGIRCDSVRQLVVATDADPRAMRSIDLSDRFDTVVLGSHLVNLQDEAGRASFLELTARHVGDAGRMVLEHHPVDWAETAAEVEPTPGAAVGMVDVRRDPPFVSAVSVFDIAGRVVRQPFTARVLSEAELADALAGIGFAVSRRLSPTFLEAGRRG